VEEPRRKERMRDPESHPRPQYRTSMASRVPVDLAHLSTANVHANFKTWSHFFETELNKIEEYTLVGYDILRDADVDIDADPQSIRAGLKSWLNLVLTARPYAEEFAKIPGYLESATAFNDTCGKDFGLLMLTIAVKMKRAEQLSVARKVFARGYKGLLGNEEDSAPLPRCQWCPESEAGLCRLQGVYFG